MIFILINIFNIVQRNPEWVKYKDKGLKHCFDLDELHMDIVAIGRRAWASKSGVPFEILENAISEEVGNNDRHEDTPELENMTSNLDQRGTLPMISTRKRARAARGLALKDGKRLSAASALNKIINRLISPPNPVCKVNANLISRWKKQALDNLISLFYNQPQNVTNSDETRIQMLHAKIGQLTVERDFLELASNRLTSASVRKW